MVVQEALIVLDNIRMIERCKHMDLIASLIQTHILVIKASS